MKITSMKSIEIEGWKMYRLEYYTRNSDKMTVMFFNSKKEALEWLIDMDIDDYKLWKRIR